MCATGLPTGRDKHWWLYAGMDCSVIVTGVPGVRIVAVEDCSREDINKGDPYEELVRVTFNRPVSKCAKWTYWRDGREFWRNPCFPQLLKPKEGTNMENPNTLYRALSTVFLVNAAAFKQADLAAQNEALANTGGKPVLFVENFMRLSNRKKLRDRLIAGDDVSMELEFNGITLTDDERATLTAIRPLLERISGMKDGYPWLGEDKSPGLSFADTRINYGGYSCGTMTGKKLWREASLYWASGKTEVQYAARQTFNGYGKVPEITPKAIKIGCQTISRADVEAVAQHYGWEPTLPVE